MSSLAGYLRQYIRHTAVDHEEVEVTFQGKVDIGPSSGRFAGEAPRWNDDPLQKLGRGMLEKSSKTTQSESGKSAVLPIRKATGRGNLAAEIDG